MNETKDIPGAQTGTLKKGIQTNRQLNPLYPDYKVPGHIQDKDWVNLSNNGRTENNIGSRQSAHSVQPTRNTQLPVIGNTVSNNLFESQPPVDYNEPRRTQFEDSLPVENYGVAEVAFHPNQDALRLSEKGSRKGSEQKSQHEISITENRVVKPKTPSIAAPPSNQVKRNSASSQNSQQLKPLHKRIDREEYMKDVQKFYGSGPADDEPQSKISKIVEQLEVITYDQEPKESND